MGLFDSFNASPTLYGGFSQNKDYTKTGVKKDTTQTNLGLNELRAGETQALGSLGTARDDVTNYGNLGINYLDEGVGQAAGYIQQGIAPQEALYGRGLGGIDAYSALLNNPDSIYDSELYKSREAAGIEELNRLANSRGMLSSGNNTQDILDYMRQGGLDYFKTLTTAHQPYFGLAQGGAAGMQSGYNQLGGMFDQLGANKANIATNTGNQLANVGVKSADVATNTGQDLANLYAGLGARTGAAYQGLGENALDTSVNVATAKQAEDAQGWQALLGLGNMLTGGLGSYVAGGGRFA